MLAEESGEQGEGGGQALRVEGEQGGELGPGQEGGEVEGGGVGGVGGGEEGEGVEEGGVLLGEDAALCSLSA